MLPRAIPLISLLAIFPFPAQATRIVAEAYVNDVVNTSISTFLASASASASESTPDGGGYLQYYGYGTPSFALVGRSSSWSGDYGSELYGGVEVTVKGMAKIIGGTGYGYVVFYPSGGAFDGGVSFNALGVNASSGDGQVSETMPALFQFHHAFEYQLRAYIGGPPGPDGENYIGLDWISVVDDSGQPVWDAQLVTGVPEPSTGVLVLLVASLPAIARRRFGRGGDHA